MLCLLVGKWPWDCCGGTGGICQRNQFEAWKLFLAVNPVDTQSLKKGLIKHHLLFHLPKNVLHVEKRHFRAVCVKPSSSDGRPAAGTIRISERLPASCKQSERKTGVLSAGGRLRSRGARSHYSYFLFILGRQREVGRMAEHKSGSVQRSSPTRD